MITNPNVLSLWKWLEKLWLRDSIRTWFDLREDLQEVLEWIEYNQFDKNNLLKSIQDLVVCLEEFSDINTDNILIDEQSWHLYLLDFIKK
jgi:hypothetical protein